MFLPRSLSFLSLALVLLHGCNPIDNTEPPPEPSEPADPSAEGGGQGGIHLPVIMGRQLICSQGAGGSYSHRANSTRHAIDLATDPNRREEVYAPVAGIVRVHDNASDGHGRHVNVDRGDGTFVVIGHFDEIFVRDMDEVVVGQLLGYEGRTGYATADHIHMSLMRGDAGQPAGYATSIPSSYWTSDTSGAGGMELLGSEQFVAGRTYESYLSVNLWHSDGTLVKTPDNARVYLLEDGLKRWIRDETTFWGLKYDFDDVVRVSQAEMDCYGQGTDIAGETLVDAVRDGEGSIWLIVGAAGDTSRYRIRVWSIGWEAVMASWGLDYRQGNEPAQLGENSSAFADWPAATGYAGLRDGTLVKETSASDVYVVSHGVALPVATWDVYLLMNYFHRSILLVEPGVVEWLHQKGSCLSGQMCLDFEAVTTCGGGLELGDGPGTGGPPEDDDDAWDDDDDAWSDDDDAVGDDDVADDDDVASDDDDTTPPPVVDDDDVSEDDDDIEPEPDDDVAEDDDDVAADDDDATPPPTDDDDATQDEEPETSTLTVSVDYPANYPQLTLTVQPVFAVSTLGQGWHPFQPSIQNDDEVVWSQDTDYTGLLGVRFNVNVDSDGDGAADDWYCYGHYTTAFLEYGVSVEITLDGDEWDENDLVTWSPGTASQTELGCSALLWFGNVGAISVGYVQ